MVFIVCFRCARVSHLGIRMDGSCYTVYVKFLGYGYSSIPGMLCSGHTDTLCEVLNPSTEGGFDSMVNNIFADRSWLWLKHPACPVREFTFVNSNEDLDTISPWLARCRMHQVAHDMPMMDIQIVSKPKILHDALTWKEWSPMFF
ncbi:hypothetical protein BDN70DRAFT_701679 [Pholiota conissans]|uniref:Uncharacterized protein n=1 Tax=Pholiota conissans TaxID=109636 RepID=A0A9P5Z1R5_9AGAR|nr:hypothetical protein BDN70DRAFT_701679 [Pholiota conissans]